MRRIEEESEIFGSSGNFRGNSSNKTCNKSRWCTLTDRQTRRNQEDDIKMFCESTLWSIGCDEHLQANRDPICLVEISSGRSVSFEDRNGEGWISEYQIPYKKDHSTISKPQTARSRIVHFLKFWTFLQFKTSTQA
ncbi:hypothetical protein Q8A67_021309 [Cirrhinus molitorella]|uniref:Uncharacterized protein n=1 Tax=Cirrhinus molitorella TaxID=172907 RepID=A0AA88PHA8_9TELE|nr:hypothetical protein Q8A67_021309 [Cirrhinus molitorella]